MSEKMTKTELAISILLCLSMEVGNENSSKDFDSLVLRPTGGKSPEIDKKFANMLAKLLINEVMTFVNSEYNGDIIEFDKYHAHIIYVLSDLALLLCFDIAEYRHAKTIIKEALKPGVYWLDVFNYIIETKILDSASDDEFDAMIAEIIAENEKAVNDIRKGKDKALSSLVGCAMKKTGGKADPNRVRESLKVKISEIQ